MRDVSDLDDVQMIVDQTLEEFGGIDILVNNAVYARGLGRVPLLELDTDILQ